jgi:hypothetical protein
LTGWGGAVRLLGRSFAKVFDGSFGGIFGGIGGRGEAKARVERPAATRAKPPASEGGRYNGVGTSKLGSAGAKARPLQRLIYLTWRILLFR